MIADAETTSHVVVMDPDDGVVSLLDDFFVRVSVRSARCTAIGGFRSATLGWFDPDAQKYREINLETQHEVVSFIDDVAHDDDDLPRLHAHCVVADREARAFGGHVMRAVVRPTLEVFVEETPRMLHRRFDPRRASRVCRSPERSSAQRWRSGETGNAVA